MGGGKEGWGGCEGGKAARCGVRSVPCPQRRLTQLLPSTRLAHAAAVQEEGASVEGLQGIHHLTHDCISK